VIRDRVHKEWSWHEGVITALAFGGFFIILGFTALIPGVFSQTEAFFKDLTTVSYPWGATSTISLVAPGSPSAHLDFYSAVMNFCLAIGILQIVILALRFAFHSLVRRIAETIGNLIFWLGAALLVNVFLLAGTINGWFQFWSLLILLLGVSLVARFLVHLATRSYRRRVPM
jgi:hypothetical protein